MAVYSYLRVSTDKQDVEVQKVGLEQYAKSHGFKFVSYVEDTASGKTEWDKRKIGDLLEHAQKGDIILVSEVSRLARSTLRVLEIVKKAVEKGVTIHITKNSMIMDGGMQSQIVATFLGMAAEIEREFLSQRTKEGLARRRAQGMKLGRPKGTKDKRLKLDEHKEAIKEQLRLGVTKANIAKMAGVSRTTLYKYIRERGLSNK